MRILAFLILILISFPVHAESTFITWPVADDAKFRAAYYAKTGETVAASSALNEAGTQYILGSSRITDEQASEIAADRAISSKDGDIKIRSGVAPDDWFPKIEEIE